MKKMILELLANLRTNSNGIDGLDGEPLTTEIDNIIDLATNLPNDDDIERWKRDSVMYSWEQSPDRMGK